MIYKLEGKYYIKLSGYLIEVEPFLKDGVLDFKSTQNKIEITSDLQYKSISVIDIREELKDNKKESFIRDNKDEKFDSRPSERTHSKYKFDKD